MQEEIVVIPEKKYLKQKYSENKLYHSEEETDKEEKIPEAKPSEAPKESVSEEDFFFTKEPAQPSGIIEMPEVKKKQKKSGENPKSEKFRYSRLKNSTK